MVSGLQLVMWPLSFAVRHRWLLSGFDFEKQTVSLEWLDKERQDLYRNLLCELW